jgi:hypothetical protein
MANTVPSIEKVVAKAFALMRRRLKAQGIEVTHVIIAVAPDGRHHSQQRGAWCALRAC